MVVDEVPPDVGDVLDHANLPGGLDRREDRSPDDEEHEVEEGEQHQSQGAPGQLGVIRGVIRAHGYVAVVLVLGR